MITNIQLLTENEIKKEICDIDSSNLNKSVYFFENEELWVNFVKGGVYSYKPVNIQIYEAFKNSESQGKFFIQYIKSNKNIECFKIGNIIVDKPKEDKVD